MNSNLMKRNNFLTVFVLFATLILCGKTMAAMNEQQKIKAADPKDQNIFGSSIDIDGNFAIVGSMGSNDGTYGAGSAYIFMLTEGKWIQKAKLVSKNPSQYGNFGHSVTISGNTAAVGAPHEGKKGAVYIFQKKDETWAQSDLVIPAEANDGDSFGWSIDSSENTVIIGACTSDEKGPSSGSAYFFNRTGNKFSLINKFVPEEGKMEDFLGCSVAISGQYAAVGAYGDDSGSDSGAAYILVNSGKAWQSLFRVTAQDISPKAKFGISVSLYGNFLLVGAEADKIKGISSGSAYLYNFVDEKLVQLNKLTMRRPIADSKYGHSVAIYPPYILIGVPNLNMPTTASGGAYIFEQIGNGWYERTELQASDAEAGDSLGYSVSLSADYAIAGALNDDDGSNNSGSTYLFDLKAIPTWTPTPKPTQTPTPKPTRTPTPIQ